MSELCDDSDSEFIIEGIRNGFSLIDPDINVSDIKSAFTPNHNSATSIDKAAVDRNLHQQIQLGNYRIVDSKPTIISGLGVVPKKNGDIRLIHDCSVPAGSAVNDYASKDPCSYQTVSDALKLIKPNWFMAKVDLKDAYRSVAIKPTQRTLTGLKWKFENCDSQSFLVDCKLPFGARKSPAIFNRLTQAVRRMMARRGINACVVLLDDFFVAAETLSECSRVLDILIRLLRSLGFSINWNKVIDPAQDIVFLGIRINTRSGRLSLDPDKVQETIALIDTHLKSPRITKSKLQQLAGKLSWASNVVTSGRAMIGALYQCIGKLKLPSHKARITWIGEDLNWWHRALGLGYHQKRIWDQRPSIGIFTDASQHGGGAFCHGVWLYRNWQCDTQLGEAHINIKELGIVQLTLEHWAPYLAGKKVTFHSDNKATVAFINRFRLPNQSVPC